MVHGFTTRAGGVSVGELASLNLALRADEQPERLRANWSLALEMLGGGFTPDQVALVDQVHGDRVLRVHAGGGVDRPCGEADALVTAEAGVVLAIRVADCVPILLSSDGAVAAVHAGWRGVAADIVGHAVDALLAAGGGSPGAVRAAIGPRISAACYPVGDEVVDGLAASGVAVDVFLRAGRRVDLGAAVLAQLHRRGVRRVGLSLRCTATDPELYSHRGDGERTGRQAALIGRVG